MDEIEVKVTWRFAWALFWRMFLMSLGIYAVIWLIAVIVFMVMGAPLCPLL